MYIIQAPCLTVNKRHNVVNLTSLGADSAVGSLTNGVGHESVLALQLLGAAVVLEDIVHLLQSFAVGLGDKVKGPRERQEAKDGEKHIGPESGILYHGRSDQALQVD